MALVYLTRRETFNAAHRLWVDTWSKEKNFEIFGKCANPHYHGHNYQLFVTVKGSPQPETGYLMDAKDLSRMIKDYITDIIDHTNLNMDPNFLPPGTQATTENLVIYMWQQLVPHLPDTVRLHCIKLQETENISAEYYGE